MKALFVLLFIGVLFFAYQEQKRVSDLQSKLDTANQQLDDAQNKLTTMQNDLAAARLEIAALRSVPPPSIPRPSPDNAKPAAAPQPDTSWMSQPTVLDGPTAQSKSKRTK